MIYSIISLFLSLTVPVNVTSYPNKKTVIQLVNVQRDGEYDNRLLWDVLDRIGRKPIWKTNQPLLIGDTMKWTIDAKEPFRINSPDLVGTSFGNLFEPGDSISIILSDDRLIFSGKGAEKLKVFQAVESENKDLKRPSKLLSSRESVENYLNWSNYVKERRKRTEKVLKSYKDSLSSFAYERIRANIISNIEYNLIIKFQLLLDQRKKLALSSADLCSIFDTTINKADNKWLQTSQTPKTRLIYLYSFAELSVLRDKNFEETKPEKDKKRDYMANHLRLVFDKASILYSGVIRDEVLLYIITDGIHELSMNPMFEKMLGLYYKSLKDPAVKAYVLDFEKKELKRKLEARKPAPYFSLKDQHDKDYSIHDAEGKTALLYFWEAGNKDCERAAAYVQKISDKYSKNANFVAIAISLDKEKKNWIHSLKDDKKKINGAVQLYTDGLGKIHPIVRGYQLDSLPAIFVVNPENKLLKNPLNDPSKDNGEELNKILNKELAESFDGPYVLYEDNNITAFNLSADSVRQENFNISEDKGLTSKTDSAEINFEIKLKDSLQIEPSVFPKPQKLFVLSDIEGEFEAFRKLLHANGVIDEKYNWTFGNGHLVFAGDMFDRGRQVTECLWLVYSLEEKARKAGGYVHFILGNHEIMNLNGNLKYLNKKYTVSAYRMNFLYERLYDEQSELGRWLRTKNIIEKIGDCLFIHGGISQEIASMNLTIEQINNTARSYYSRELEVVKSKDPILFSIFSQNSSPFWYRGYYKGNKSEQTDIINNALKRFSASRIITGHSVVSDKISSHYEGKVINTDTKHAHGQSAGLLIEGNNLYSTGADGKRQPLVVF